MVDIQHYGVGAFDEDLGVLLFCGGEERDLVDDIGGKSLAELLNLCQLFAKLRPWGGGKYLEFRDFIIRVVVLQQITEALLVSLCHPAELGLEDSLVEEVAHAETVPGHLTAVCWAYDQSVSFPNKLPKVVSLTNSLLRSSYTQTVSNQSYQKQNTLINVSR